ncbi:hypothetical protein BC830DRAFT_1108550 [Chytriomyces sp. MP71]|nr:hypothetical protein BC830DRAFT_1108550 [Chytriomyces sp. MP71]
MYNNGRYMGEEVRDKGVNVQLGPVANMMRTPQAGRIWEAQGADPFLTGVSVTNIIDGVQSNGVQSTLKHFVLNDQEAHRDDGGSSNIDKKTLMEYYVRPFKMAIQSASGGPSAIMCSYNAVNGVNACDSPFVMNILKNELGFQGYVMSDWWATHTELDGVKAGLDMVMPGSYSGGDQNLWWGSKLVGELNNPSRINDLATRILAGWYRVHQDDSNFPVTNFNSWNPTSGTGALNVQRDHKSHIRAVGAASSILLKNNGALPLTSRLSSIALIGSDAITPPSGPPQGDHGSNPDGTLAQGWGSGTTTFPYIVSPVDGISAVANQLGIKYSVTSNNWDLNAVRSAASQASLSVVFVNSDSGEGYINVLGNSGDRQNLTLWNNGDELVKAAASKGPTVVVIHAPGAVDMSAWIDLPNVNAVIMALMPGQETGNAIADVLFGKVNPSGRLPFTIGHNINDYVTQIDFGNKQVNYGEGAYFDYRWNQKNNIAPLFPFGHGLSYTSFAYSGFAASKACNGAATVNVQVSNTGKVDGAEVVQLYLAYPAGVDQPAKQLKGFKKVSIAAGQVASVSIDISADAIATYDVPSSSWVVPNGIYTVYVGASSADLRGSATFVVDSSCGPTPSTSAIKSKTTTASSGPITSSAPSPTTSASNCAINNWLPGSGPCLYSPNCDWQGQDLSSATVPGEKCSDTCKQTPGCTHFTWTNYNGGTCWMKSGAVDPCTAIVVTSSNALCGYMVSPTTSAAPPSPTTTAAKPSTSSAAPVTTQPVTTQGNCSPKWGQCGGNNWTGPKCCVDSTCTLNNEWYSQCL